MSSLTIAAERVAPIGNPAIASVEERIAAIAILVIEVADKITLVSVQVENISDKIESTMELRKNEEDCTEKEILWKYLQSLMEEKAKLMDKEAKLMDKEAKLMDEKKILMEEKAKLSDTQAAAAQHITRAMGCISFSTLITTPQGQSNASSFAGTEFAFGFGFLPTSFLFDPTFRTRVWSSLVPSYEMTAEMERKGLSVLGELGNLLPQGEESTDSVRSILDLCLRIPQLQSSRSRLSLSGGIATAASKPDFLWTLRGTPFGVLEVKGGSSSVLSALRQAAITATNIAVSLLRRGFNADDIIVPVAGSTGRVMQFGAVIVLAPSFPTFVPTSSILDLASDESNALANAYLSKASRWVEEFGSTLKKEDAAAANLQMTLDVSKYHIKKLDEKTLKRGLGLFSSSSDPGVDDVGPGLLHMGRVLNKLFASPSARAIAVFPLSVRSPGSGHNSPDDRDSRCYWLVYEDLASVGFKIGTPDRIHDHALYKRFLVALQRAIAYIHNAGVLHCDLYPSNYMWKADGDDQDVVIRIIDWDNAHCLDELDFSEKCKNALREHKPTRSATFGVAHDWKYFNVLKMDVISEDEKLWTDLSSNDKKVIDNAFYALFPATS